MGYVDAAHAAEGAAVGLTVRGTTRSAHVARLPFVPHRYHRARSNPSERERQETERPSKSTEGTRR
jgi:hypothetical protein